MPSRDFKINDVEINITTRTTKTEEIEKPDGSIEIVEVEYEIDMTLTKGEDTKIFKNFNPKEFTINPFTANIYHMGKPLFPIKNPLEVTALLFKYIFCKFVSGVKYTGGELSTKLALSRAWDSQPEFIQRCISKDDAQIFIDGITIPYEPKYKIAKNLLNDKVYVTTIEGQYREFPADNINVDINTKQPIILLSRDNKVRIGINKFQIETQIRDVVTGSTIGMEQSYYDANIIPIQNYDYINDNKGGK